MVASRVTRAGPVTKTTSSATPSTAKAVCRSSGVVSRCAHRPRTIVPIWGIEAPASTAHRCGQTSAQPAVIETVIRLAEAAKTTAVDVQHPALAEAVGQPAVGDGEDGVAQDVGGRDLPGEGVGAGQRAHQ